MVIKKYSYCRGLLLITALFCSIGNDRIYGSNVQSDNDVGRFDHWCREVDTVYSNGDFAKCTNPSGTICRVKVRIQKKEAYLKEYNCDLDYHPRPYYHDKKTIEFMSGNSSGYRYFVICELVRNRIIVAHFLTIKHQSMEPDPKLNNASTADVYIFKKPSDKTRIYCKGRFTNTPDDIGFFEYSRAERSLALPKKYYNYRIKESRLYKKYIEIHFTNGKQLRIKHKL